MSPGGDPLEAWLAGLHADEAGVVVPVHAQPGAHRDGLVGLHGQALKIATSAPAEGGRATRRIGATLAAALGLAPSRVRCVAGASARAKRYRAELSLAECRRRLKEALG